MSNADIMPGESDEPGRGPDSVASEALVWNSKAAGVGALLMTDPNLPRDQFHHPYQPLFWFDDHSRPIGLVVDGDDHVLAWENNAQGDPDVIDKARCQRVPPAVERAARDWWAEQQSAGTH